MVTPIFITGAEAGVNVLGATGLTPVWNAASATVTIDGETVHNGQRSYRINLSNSKGRVQKNVSTTRLVVTLAIRFATLPSADSFFLIANNASGDFYIYYESSDSKLYAQVNPGGQVVAGPTITTGTWYVLDIDFDATGATAYINWKVNGTSQNQASYNQASATINYLQIGEFTNNLTSDMYADDIVFSYTAADYPIGEVKVLGFSPNASGDHSFTNGDFKDSSNGAIALPAGNVHSLIDERPITNGADYVKQVVARAAGYVRFGFEDTTETTNAIGLEVVSSQHAGGTPACNASMYLDDGGSLGAIYEAKDISQTSLIYHSICFATRPNAGGAWTQAAINAVASRWGYSTDISPNPYLDGVILEIAWLVAAAPEPDIYNADALRALLKDQEYAGDGKRISVVSYAYLSDSFRMLVEDAVYGGDSIRVVNVPSIYPADSMRSLIAGQSYLADTLREIVLAEAEIYPADTMRKIIQSHAYLGDTLRILNRAYSYNGDSLRVLTRPYEYPSDSLRSAIAESVYLGDALRSVFRVDTYPADSLREIVLEILEKYPADTLRTLVREDSLLGDLLRQIIRDYSYSADTLRLRILEEIYRADTERIIQGLQEYLADTLRQLVGRQEYPSDTLRIMVLVRLARLKLLAMTKSRMTIAPMQKSRIAIIPMQKSRMKVLVKGGGSNG